MAKAPSEARQVRKMRASRDGWKERAAEKQAQIKRLRGTVRDLVASRDHWKTRAHESEQQVQALQQAQALQQVNASTLCAFPALLILGG